MPEKVLEEMFFPSAGPAGPISEEDKKRWQSLAKKYGYKESELEAPPEEPYSPPHLRLGGAYENRLLEHIRKYGWKHYDPQNMAKGGTTLNNMARRLKDFISNPTKTQFVFITGNPGTGKTRLAHHIAYRALDHKQKWRGLVVRDSEVRRQLQRMEDHPEWNYADNRPATPIETWVARAPELIVIDEFGKAAVEFGRGDRWVGVWLELLTRLMDNKKNRLVVVCSNIPISKLEEWEASLPGGDGTSPIASRLTAKDVIQIHLAGKDWRKG